MSDKYFDTEVFFDEFSFDPKLNADIITTRKPVHSSPVQPIVIYDSDDDTAVAQVQPTSPIKSEHPCYKPHKRASSTITPDDQRLMHVFSHGIYYRVFL